MFLPLNNGQILQSQCVCYSKDIIFYALYICLTLDCSKFSMHKKVYNMISVIKQALSPDERK